jgi:hypothetical protein
MEEQGADVLRKASECMDRHVAAMQTISPATLASLRMSIVAANATLHNLAIHYTLATNKSPRSGFPDMSELMHVMVDVCDEYIDKLDAAAKLPTEFERPTWRMLFHPYNMFLWATQFDQIGTSLPTTDFVVTVTATKDTAVWATDPVVDMSDKFKVAVTDWVGERQPMFSALVAANSEESSVFRFATSLSPSAE